jgi:exodeoxyribonuclease VII large subunit
MAKVEPMTITQFCNLVKDVIPNKKYLVSGEVNQLKNSHGHLFFTFKDNENCISTTVWKSKVEMLKINIKEGDKITVEGKLDFYGASGKLNFILDKVVTNEGLGNLLKKYEKIKDDFLKKGYFDKNRKKQLKPFIKNVLILTSESGAAYQDFIFALENASCNINLDLIDVIVQGSDCPKNICNELEKIKNNDDNSIYDLVIITRGGGSFQDLFGFSQPELIETIYNFNLPILSAIGHQVDNPLSDLICDFSTPTPSLAAQFIIDYNKNYIQNLKKIEKAYLIEINNIAFNYLTKLNNNLNEINTKLFQFINNKKNEIINELQNNLRQLDYFESKLEIYNSKDIMLYSNGQILRTPEELYNNKEKTMLIVWNNITISVKIVGKIIKE